MAEAQPNPLVSLIVGKLQDRDTVEAAKLEALGRLATTTEQLRDELVKVRELLESVAPHVRR